MTNSLVKHALPLSISAAAVSVALAISQQYSILKSIGVAIIAAYLPSYFDGSEYDGTRYHEGAGRSKMARFVWRKLLGLPLAEVRWNRKDFKNKDQQFIFGSHPHGVFGWHHIGLMMTPAACESGASFEDLYPQRNRRELAASLIVTVPILRDIALACGVVDASRHVRVSNLPPLCQISFVVAVICFFFFFLFKDRGWYVGKGHNHRHICWRRARTTSQ
jgi:hypothetical protein